MKLNLKLLSHGFRLTLICIFCFFVSGSSQIITTIAGNGYTTYSGDGGLATTASFYPPYTIAVDGSGGLFISSYGYSFSGYTGGARIRRINSSGIIYTYVGTGYYGYSGDGGPASSAEIQGGGVATDAHGNLYITDLANFVIRKVNTSGIISTIAGNGTPGYTGDGGPATAAQIGDSTYFAYWDNGFTSDPYGNIYFYNYVYDKIRKVDTTGIITTFCGTGSTGATGDGGPATAATMGTCYGICADSNGNVYYADWTYHKVRKINSSGIITTVAGTGGTGFSGDGGPATAAQIYHPSGISIDLAGNIFICSFNNERIRKINSAGIITTIAGNGTPGYSGDGGLATTAQLYGPIGSCVDAIGNLYISDYDNARIRKVTFYPYTLTFTGGHSQGLSMCENSGSYSLNSLLEVHDSTTSLTATWSILSSPYHGSATVAYSATTTGGIIIPTGLTYIPLTGYYGIDSFRVRVTDGVHSDTTTIVVSITRFDAGIITGSTSVCLGNIITLIDTTSGGIWGSSNTSIATITSGGIVTGVANGTATITYTTTSICGSIFTLKTVTVYPLPVAPTGPTSLCAGSTITLTSGGGGTWSTSSSNITLGSSTGIVTGVAAGTALISYTLSTGCYITRPVTVNANPLPITGSAAICVGTITYLSDATPGGSWSSSNPLVASVTPFTGVVTGIAGGTATITYTLSTGCMATYVVTINPLPSAITGLNSICMGISTTLSDSVIGGTWSSSDGTIAPITATTGVYTGFSPGSVTITYTLPTGCSVTKTVTINAMPGTIIGAASVCVGLTTTLSDTVTGGTWSSSSLPVATVDPLTGIVFGVSPGTATLFYTLPGGCAVSKVVTVNTAAAAIAGPSQVCVNGTITLTDPSGAGTWTSSAPAIATIGSTSGILTGLLSGTVTVTYTMGAGCTVSKIITVNPLPALITGTPLVCVGSTNTLSDLTPGGIWSSSIPGNATVNTSGVLTGIAAGLSVIDYTLTATGCYSSVTATINPLPAIIAGPSSVCQGANISLTDATTGGSWISAPTAIATIGSGTGVVLGVTPGTATITYTLSTGCSRTQLVTVNPLPTAISGPASLCQGSTTTLTDAGGGIWSTMSANATIGSTTGLVTGVLSGTALITYSISTGCSITRTETINPLPAAIGGPTALCVGTTITLTDPGGGTWGSITPSVATVGSTTGIVSGLLTGTTTITYSLPTGCTTAEVVTVSTTPSAIAGPSSVCAGSNTPFTDAVAGGLWTSTNLTAATVGSLSGIVTGLATGVTNLSYSLGSGCTVGKTVTVLPSPAAIVGSSSICISGTAPMTDATTGGTWSITPITAGTISSTGIVTGLAAGIATVDYTAAGCPATKSVTVNTTPTAIAGSGTVCAGSVTTETDAVTGGTWSTTGASISVGSMTGVVSGVSAGTGTLSYSIGSCSVSRTISVNPVPSISGSTGICTGTTSALTASITGGTWGGGALAVATVNATTGLVTGIAPGSTAISYTLSTGCIASVVVAVNGAPGSITGTLHVCAGSTTTLGDGTGGGTWSITPATTATVGSSSGMVAGIISGTATVTYSIGSGCTVTAVVTVNPVPLAISGTAQVCTGLTTALSDATTGGAWSSSSMATGTVSGTGIVAGIAAGTTTISYTLPTGCSATYPVTVNPVPTPMAGTTSLCAGLTAPFTDITPGGTWSTAPVIIATVGSTGIVLGVTPGIATITYTLATGCTASKSITINSAPVPIAGSSVVCIGSTIALTDGTGGGIWSSSAPAIGSIATTGIVTGLSIGTTVISYVAGGCPAVKTVSVNALPGPIAGPATVCISATVTATDAGGGTWSSSNPVIASIGSGTGIITGMAAGTATISYSMGVGCTVTKMITVNPLPAAITASSSNVCLGATLALADATPGGGWTSGSPAIAAVSTTGVVTGVTGGVSLITYTAPSGCIATRAITVISVSPISGVHNICAYGDTMTVSDVPGTGLYVSTLATITSLGGGLGRVTGNTPGSASVTYILPSGCSANAVFTVNPLPAAISGGGGHICSGSSVTFTDATPGGAWSTSGTSIVSVGSTTGIVTGISSGTAYVTYTLTSTGCKTDTTETVYTTPAAITGPSSLFLGTPIALSDAVTGGTWSSSNTLVATVGVGTGNVTGISVGAVTITYNTGGSCYVTKHITVMPAAGGHKASQEENEVTERENIVRVSPNPGDGGFIIALNWSVEETVQITISNVAGIKIKEWSAVIVKVGKVQIPVQIDVASGVYLLSISGSEYKYVTKVVVER